MKKLLTYYVLILIFHTYGQAQVKWAGSNVYWDGTRLTFASTNDPQIEIKKHYQGVFFKWGSLVGISPVGSFNESFTKLYVPDLVSDSWSITTAYKKGWNWFDIPYANNATLTDERKFNKLLSKEVFNYAEYKGDICRFLSGKTGIPAGNWRMPTSLEFEREPFNIPNNSVAEPFGNAEGTSSIRHYAFNGQVFFPASGYLDNDYGLMSTIGQHGEYWSGSPHSDTGAYFVAFSQGINNNYINRSYAMPVRCVCEQENATLNQSQSPNGIFFNDYTKNGNDYQLLGVGSNIPDISISLLNEENIRIADLKGKIVLLSFFATWCGPCRFDFKYIKDEIWDAIKNKDFLILAIATFKDTPEKVKSNTNYNNLPFPVGFDSDESSSIIRQFYGPKSTISVPYDILIGRDGKVLKAHVGYDKETLDDMKEIIQKEL